MIAYGIKTWKSIAMPAVLFLGLSVFLFLQAVQMDLKIRNEVKAYGQITCIINETAQERILEQSISAVASGGRGSFVYELPVIIYSNSMSKEINVTGIDTQMIPGTLISGRYYEDNVSTPEIVMNMAAFSDLLKTVDDSNIIGNSVTEMSEADSCIGRTLIMGKCGATICGIVDDGADTPSLYISVPAAKTYLKQQGEIPKAASYCVRVSDLTALMITQEKMNEMGISTSIDESKTFQWKMMGYRIRDLRIMGLIAFAGFVFVISLSIKCIQKLEALRSTGVYVARVIICLCVGCLIGVAGYLFTTLWYVA